jgi:hypothetical protein
MAMQDERDRGAFVLAFDVPALNPPSRSGEDHFGHWAPKDRASAGAHLIIAVQSGF